MNCENCGATLAVDDLFCSQCGSRVEVNSGVCPSCSSGVPSGASFCRNCGYNLRKGVQAQPEPVSAPQGINSDLSDIAPGEVVVKDSGVFPISYVKGLASSVNGKLYLTNRRLVFRAGKLQGVGGVYVSGMYIPNPADAKKSKEYLSIPLAEITNVETGWSSLTVHVGGQEYKFGAMRETKKWAEAIQAAHT